MTDPAFPRLTDVNSRVTSPAERTYNCIAWAAGDATRWWQPALPGSYWPLPDDEESDRTSGLVAAYRAVGFEPCEPGDAADGVEVVALYGTDDGFWTHAARRLPGGTWASKLGRWVDIEHDTPDDVAGGVYGEVFAFMRRPFPPA